MSGTRLLLDTHTILWFASGHPSLSRLARASIERPGNQIFVSAASAWEVTTKVRLGKLQAGRLGLEFASEVLRQGFHPLPVTLEHGERAGRLPGYHGDPFDRMLIAQAQTENLTLVSNEELFDRYGVTRIW